MRRTVIVGNGFISHLVALINKDIEKGKSNLTNLKYELENVSTLFDEFDSLDSKFKELLGLNQTISAELVYQLTDNIISWHQSMSSYQNVISSLGHCIENINEIGSKLINDKIYPITKKFEDQEQNGVYGEFTSWTKNIVGKEIEDHLNSKSDELGVFTTNYDGFLEQLLRTNGGSQNGFLLKDGFAGGINKPKTMYEPNFSKDKFIGHLHSSYKFGWNGENWEKFNLEKRNHNPLIIYMNPNKKLENIKNKELLFRYWLHFEWWLENSDEIIVYGNSLTSDPHIVEELNSLKHKPKFYFANINFESSTRLSNQLSIDKSFIDTSNIELNEICKIFTAPEELIQNK